jgi:hypothetical protein
MSTFFSGTPPEICFSSSAAVSSSGRAACRKAQHRRRHQTLHQADGQMNGLHQQQKRLEGQSGDAGGQCLQHHAERAQLQRRRHGQHGGRRDALFRQPPAEQRAVNQRPADETGAHTHVEDVAPQRQQSAVGEEQALDDQHRRDGQQRGERPQNRRQQDAPADVAGGSGAGNGEIDHLGGEHERAHHAHHGNFFLVQPARRKFFSRRGRWPRR